MVGAMLNWSQLQDAVAAAKRAYGLLKKKHPSLTVAVPPDQKREDMPDPNPYLVLSLPGGQTVIDSPPQRILREFPAMIADDSVKTNALALLSRLNSETTPASEKRELKKELDQLAAQLKYDETCQVEIRFKKLDYDLIWKLQTDDLVDRTLTPRTKASIRIVLGTLAHFERTSREH